jgi:hypothetical protein
MIVREQQDTEGFIKMTLNLVLAAALVPQFVKMKQ